jgi:PAS domain-containing protein
VSPFSTHQAGTTDDATSREQTLLDSLDAAVAIWDRDDRLVRFNRQYADLLSGLDEPPHRGARFEGLVYRSVEAGLVLPPDGASTEWLKRRLALHRAPGDSFEVELSGKRWYRVKETRVGDGHTMTLLQDVTESRHRETQLRASEDRFRTLIELSGDAVFVLGGGRVMFINRAGATLLGAKTPDELTGMVFDTLRPTKQRRRSDAVSRWTAVICGSRPAPPSSRTTAANSR